jgi:protein involved in polysaccharide export with SLBB domain
MRIRLARILLTLTVALGVLGSPAMAQSQGYVIRPGDKLAISFFTAAGTAIPEITGERIVDRDGEIFLPYVGSLQVLGLDAIEVRELLEDRFGAFYSSPVIDVVATLKVNVTGAVPRPGSFFLDPTSTVVDAVSAAGGTGTGISFAGSGGGSVASDPSAVRLVRDGVTSIIDLSADNATEDGTQLVLSGDWIFVPPAGRSRWRDNIDFISSIVTLIAATAGLILLFSSN